MRKRLSTAVLTVAAVAAAVVLPTPAQAVATVGGQWSAPFELGGVAIHAALLRTGEVILFQDVEGKAGVDHSSLVRIWDPATGVARDADLGYDRDLFCASQDHLPDGRLYVAGGHATTTGKKQDPVGAAETDLYDPVTQRWTPGPVMGQARWYSTSVEVADGRTLTFGGQATTSSPSNTVSFLDPVTNTGGTLPASATKAVGLNPRMHLLPTGKIVKTGPAAVTSYFDPATNLWSNGPAMRFGARTRGVSVLLPGLKKVLEVGGAAGSTPTNTAEILDTSVPAPAWRTVAPMNHARQLETGLVLPDGKVLIVGGGAQFKYTGPVLTPELFDPVTETWTDMADQLAGRMYHQTMLLLPDGRVLSMGQDNGPYATKGEIFSPPYLFKGPRPAITAAPTAVGYGQPLSITSPQAAGIGKVVLIKNGAMTHQVDTDQRNVELGFTASGTTISATSPATAAVAPPGDYMLFLVDGQGVPSVSRWVRVGA